MANRSNAQSLVVPVLTLFITTFSTPALSATTPTIFDLWVDHRTKTQVRVFPCPGSQTNTICARVARLNPDSPTVDYKNANPQLRNRSLLGLQVLSDFAQVDNNRWEGGGENGRLPGRIYDPSNGNTLGERNNRYYIKLTTKDTLTLGIVNCRLLTCLTTSKWSRVASLKHVMWHRGR